MNRRVRLTLKTVAKLVVAFIFVPLCLNAQDKEMSTLFGDDGTLRLGGYGAFEIRGSQLDGSFGGLLLGGRGGVIINNVFSFGGAGYGLMPTKKIDCPIPGHEFERNTFWTGGYGGLFFEYINSSNNLLHFTVNALIGGGGVTFNNHSIDERFLSHPVSAIFVVEPGVTAELNVFKTFRMSLGLSYRYAPNFELKYTDSNGMKQDIVPNTAFNGISLNLAFIFGNFSGIEIDKDNNK